MRVRFGVLTVVHALALVACASGQKQFQSGESAYRQGDLDAAESAYKQALAAEPGNAEYKSALDKVEADIAKQYEEQARAKEKQEDWKGASDAWARASAAQPSNNDYKARKELSALKAQNLGPDEWYEAVKKVDKQIPKNAIVDKTLQAARTKAWQYHITLAEQFKSSSEGGRALQHYDRAKEIDPSGAIDAAHYDEALAYSLMEQGDQKLAQGDALEAHELYQKAYEKKALPELKAKLAKVKQKASAVLSKIEAARALEQKGKHLEALHAYESVAGTKGAPASLEAEVKKVKGEVSSEEAARASKSAEQGDLSRAKKSLDDAFHYSALEPAQLDALKSAASEVTDGRPGKGARAVEDAKIEAKEPLVAAVKAYALAAAKKTLDKAKALSKKDPAGALAAMADLGPFEDTLPEIKELKRQLRAGSFQEMLDEALKLAKKGNDEEASMTLLAALSASNAPNEMRTLATEGADAIKSKKYVDAEIAFQKAMALEPRSKLAQRGIDVARIRRHELEAKALATLKAGSGEEAPAVDVLADALRVDPQDANARQGAEILLQRAESSQKLSDEKLAQVFAGACKLADVPASAKPAIDEARSALEKSDYGSAGASFHKALESAPSLKLAKLGEELSKKRMVASLKSGAKRAVEGDETGAKKLAELLKADPHDKDALKALASILDKAKSAAKSGEDGEAARQLQLAAIVTSPSAAQKTALDRGIKALGASKMEEAQKGFQDALDVDANDAGAKVGLEIAKAGRSAQMSKAVASAKQGNVEQAKAALERSMAVDPNGPDAKQALDDLLEEAKRQGSAGNDRQAAALLDAANVSSKTDALKKSIESADKLLADGKHAEAGAAFARVEGDSRVATVGKEIAQARSRANLIAGAEELKSGQDVERGAKATKELLKLEPTNAEAKSAIEGALDRAQTLAAQGDDKASARVLKAVARAVGEDRDLEGALMRYESGKLDAAEADLQKHDSELAHRALKIVHERKLGTLKAGLSGDDRKQAESIKAILAGDPTNKEALGALAKLLDKARSLSGKGDDKGAADALESAMIASSPKDDLASSLKVAFTHLGEKRYAQAEQSFAGALEIASDSRVAKAGHEIAKKSRLKVEKDEVAELAKSAEPVPAAKRLAQSLIVEPESKVVQTALKDVLARAKSLKSDDAQGGRLLEAAGVLENVGSEEAEALAAASALYAKGSFEEAETAFSKGTGKVATFGRELSRERRIGALKADLDAAKKEGDVLRQSVAVQKILSIDPHEKTALDLSKKLKGSVLEARLAAARQQKESGKPGVAYLYLKRALELDPSNAKAKAEIEAITSSLKEALDLIVLVDQVARSPQLSGTTCKGMEAPLREALMADGSKRNDLGAYVLSPDWTKAVERQDKKAPQVSGKMKVTLAKCEHGAGTGNATLEWELDVPPESGSAAAKGTVDANLPSGMIPRDEQDGEGKNAERALSRRAAKALFDKMVDARTQIDLWLLTLAEQGMKSKNAALAADAYARLLIKRPASIDPTRASEVERYLEAEFK
jgi:tetratricopeptide (TPR) repeat protein